MYQSASGMETPLTFLLLAVGVLALLRPFPGWIIGAIAGLLVVNKLDLVPFAAFLVLAYWVRFRKFPFEAVCISSVIGLAWYGFAQLYFGSLVPNSFVTKALHQDNLPHNIDWTWFGRRTFLGTPPWAGPELFPGTHAWALLLALLGMLLASNKWRPLYIYLLGGLLIHFIVYTAKPPFEPYDWYTMPSTLALYILAAVGFSNVLAFLNKRLEIRSQKIEIFSTIILIAALWLVNLQHEKWQTTTVKFFVAHEEVDRAEAGRWVDRNVPQHFRIMTFWGNAAYHSHRQTIDASFLNRDIRLGLPRGKESAEVIITVCRGGGDPSECANQLVPLLGEETASTYITVRVFDKHFSTGVSDYFYVVLVRHDVLHELRSIGVPLGLHMRN
jgi:hypothetical protein